ncbi:MAG TPA: M90 family metallopeptidase [Kofleriaceae bacterium]|nr:M90 family metallopeptidase [Kofleriaceae bacterium]
MLRWLTERRRRRILETPFPEAWDGYIAKNVAIARRLGVAERMKLRELVQVFIAEKNFEGCGGLELTDEMKVTIAAQACVLLLGRDASLYDDVGSILVYPSTVRQPPRRLGLFEQPSAPVGEGLALQGEAIMGGPVILAWDHTLASAREEIPGNLVFHELAHKIDMANGAVDGAPPLGSRAEIRRWAAVCSAAFARLRQAAAAGLPTALDPYGATNEAEFFAVATEAYFTQPGELRAAEPELYAVLAAFYRFEPRDRPTPPDPFGLFGRLVLRGPLAYLA